MTQGTAGFMLGDSSQPRVVVEPEPDLSEDDLRVLLSDDAPAAAPVAEDVDDGDEDSEEEASSANNELAQLKQDLARTQGALAALMRGGQQGAVGTQDPIEAYTKKFFDGQYADVPEETRTFFKDYGKGLVELVTGAVGQRLQGLERTLQESSGKQVLNDFETQLGTVMSRAGLVEAEQEIFKESVMMDGLRRYGNSFTTDQAIRLFRSKHKKYLDARQDRQAKDERELDEERTTAPPATRRGGNLAAREDVVGKLMKSDSPENSFGGRNWRQHIAARFKQASQGGA